VGRAPGEARVVRGATALQNCCPRERGESTELPGCKTARKSARTISMDAGSVGLLLGGTSKMGKKTPARSPEIPLSPGSPDAHLAGPCALASRATPVREPPLSGKALAAERERWNGNNSPVEAAEPIWRGHKKRGNSSAKLLPQGERRVHRASRVRNRSQKYPHHPSGPFNSRALKKWRKGEPWKNRSTSPEAESPFFPGTLGRV
jgi:hypothetical protein